jgi:hypothetical protein
VNARDKSGMSVLDQAASSNHMELVRLLFAKGAEVITADEGGFTPLMGAAGNGDRNAELFDYKAAIVDGDTVTLIPADRPGDTLVPGWSPEGDVIAMHDVLRSELWWALGPDTVYFFELTRSIHPQVRLRAFDIAEHRIRELGTLRYPVVNATPAIAVSPDGRHLAYAQIDSMEADIMLMRNVR